METRTCDWKTSSKAWHELRRLEARLPQPCRQSWRLRLPASAAGNPGETLWLSPLVTILAPPS